MKPRARKILITTSAAVAGVGIATALALLLIVPFMRNTCTLFTKRCMNISYKRNESGQILVPNPATGLTYWYDGNFIRSYGPYLPGMCPSSVSRTIPDTNVGIGNERVLCERFRPDGTCASESGGSTIPTQLAGETRQTEPGSIMEPAFVMNASTLMGSDVLCSRARDVVQNSFSDTKTHTIKVRLAPGTDSLDVSQVFKVLRDRGIFTPPSKTRSLRCVTTTAWSTP